MTADSQIGDHPIGVDHPAFVIAEIAQAHDGSLGFAHSFIDLAADCGADAVKFQTHIAQAESTYDEPFRVPFSYEDATRFDYWRRMEFEPTQWEGLARHAGERGLVFLSSAFSVEAVELLRSLGVPAWKVASGEVRNAELLSAMVAGGEPILLSSGMSDFQQLDRTVSFLRDRDVSIAVLQCTTKYPTPFADVGLNVLDELRQRYGVPVGLSDHTGSIFPALSAMARGADLIEVHLRFHRSQFGPDTVASLDPADLRRICKGRDAIFEMLRNPVEKSAMARELRDTAALFDRSLALRDDTPAGAVLEASMLTGKKPAGGIPYPRLEEFVGRRLARDVPATRLLHESDFEEAD